MKPALLAGLAIAAVAAAYLIGLVVPATGRNRLILTIGLGVIFLAAVALFAWYQNSKEKSSEAATPDPGKDPGKEADDVELLLREAETKLAAAKIEGGKRIGALPVIIVLGAKGSTKTTSILHSGLEPELLAGQIYQDGNVIPTRLTNIWYAAKSIFVEAGSRFLDDSAAWNRLVARLRPAKLGSVMGKSEQAPRALAVFADAETFLQPGAANTSGVAARSLHARLSELSQSLGISVPVYVLFTRIDRVPYFQDYVRNFSNQESTQVFGVTLPILPARTQGVYGEQESARLGDAFNDLFYSLADKRQEYLARETDPTKAPSVYEFPREFRKLRGPLVSFLVELCRPSQLTIGPFLRGFYFSGVRPVQVQEAAPIGARQPAVSPAFSGDPAATAMFHRAAAAQEAAIAAPMASGATRRVPQWVFLSHFYNDILLHDEAALGASGSSIKTNALRRWLLGIASAVFLLLAIAFLVSFVRNREMVSTAIIAANALSSGQATATGPVSTASLNHLETLRQSLERLESYDREGAPLSMRWGLYTGDGLYPQIRTIYFNRFQALLLGPLQRDFAGSLKNLPASPGPKDDYNRPYDTLKAYLMTTSNHEKSTRQFLAPLLLSRWSEGQGSDPARAALAKRQFDFYTDELKIANPLSSENDAPTIAHARHYLGLFGGAERVYNLMLADVNRNNPPVNFNAKFPGSAQIVLNNKDVAGAFTKSGFAAMQDDIQHRDRFFSGEQWVLGDQAGAATIDRATLEAKLRGLYQNDFVSQWREYLRRSAVVKYQNLADAASKLQTTSGSQSPLLEMFWLASQNTGVDDPNIANAFQAVHKVVPPGTNDFVAPTNADYLKELAKLQSALDSVAQQPGQQPSEAAAQPVLESARNAHLVARQIGLTFGVDPEAGVVQKLLEDPITSVEGLLKGLGPAELNNKGKGLCNQMSGVTSKYPFNVKSKAEASLAEFNSIFKPKEGAIWTFYDANLQKLLAKEGSRYVEAPGATSHMTPRFLDFFNRAASLSDGLYQGNSPDPHFTFSLKPAKSDGVDNLDIEIDGQTLTYSSGAATPKQFPWPGTPDVKAQIPPFSFSTHQGLWAAFKFFDDADEQSGGSYAWRPRSGKDQQPVQNNKGVAVVVRLDLDMDGNPPVFQRGYLSALTCVAEVAK